MIISHFARNSNRVGKLFVLPFVTFLNFIMLLYISFCNLFIGLRHKKIKKYREGYESCGRACCTLEDKNIVFETWISTRRGLLSAFPAGTVLSRNFIRDNFFWQILLGNIAVVIKICRCLTTGCYLDFSFFFHNIPSFRR